MEQSLFEKYGGFATIHKVVEHFYDGVLENTTSYPHGAVNRVWCVKKAWGARNVRPNTC